MMGAIRRIMHAFKLDEISAVTEPAQTPARASIIKRAGTFDLDKALELTITKMGDCEEQTAMSFADVLARMDAQEREEELREEVWPLQYALMNSLRSITADPNLDAKKRISAMKESVAQFSSTITARFPDLEAEAEVGKLLNGTALSRFAVLAANPGGDHVGKKESPMADNDKTVASLEVQLATITKANADLEAANAVLKAEVETLKKDVEIAKSDEVLEIEGVTLRKSETNAATFEIMKKQQERIDLAGFEKQAQENIPFLPGTPEIKAQVFKAVSRLSKEISDEIVKMLKAGSEALKTVTKTAGTEGGADNGGLTPAQEIDALAKAKAEKDSVPYIKAYNEVLKTDKGRELYSKLRQDLNSRQSA